MNELLALHVAQLKQEGYSIEVTPDGSGDQARYFVVFKDYPLPNGYWNRDRVDMLVIVPGAYPNPKLDMFYVYPKILLTDGIEPQAGNIEESYMGRSWQRFSWHLATRDPGYDCSR